MEYLKIIENNNIISLTAMQTHKSNKKYLHIILNIKSVRMNLKEN